MMTGVLYQLISMLSFGTSNVLWKTPQKYLSVYKIIFLRTIVSVLLFGILALVFLSIKGDLYDWAIAFIISLVSFLGLLFYNFSIKKSKVSHSITITSTSAVFGVITSVLAYGEEIHLTLVLCLLLIVIGLFLLESKKPILKWSRGTFYAILAAFFWGTTFALFRIPVEKIGSYNFSLVLETSVLLGAGILLVGRKKDGFTGSPTTSTYLSVALIGVLGFVGVLFYNFAVIQVKVSTLAVMGAFTPVISIIISHLFLKERFSSSQYLGMASTLIGVILLTAYS